MKNALVALVFGFLGAFIFQQLEPQFFTTASAGGTEKIVQATQFNLVDSKGSLRAQLGFAKEGPPGLWIMDEKGVARIAMGLYPDGTSHIGLQDKNGLMIQLMRSTGASEAPLLIFKNKGQDRVMMGLTTTGIEPFLVSFDTKGKKTVPTGFVDGP